MLNLPTELWIDIGSQPCVRRMDLLALMRVNWAFHDIFIRVLYSSVHIHFETPANITNLSDSRPTFSPSVQCLLDRLESDNRLRNCVQECKITDSTPINRQDQNQYEEFVAPLMTLVGELPNLGNVYLVNLTCHVKWFTYLASRPALRLSIGIWRCTPYGDVMHSGPYTAISLSSNGLIGDVRHIAFGASLRRFDLSFIGTMNLLASHSRLGSPILGALRELYIYDFYPDLINLFRCTPNIVELKFRSQGSINDVNPNGWDGVARKLESFQGDKVLIPLLIVGRPIRSIHLHFHQIRREPILRYFGLDFGSTVPLRQVILPYSRYLEESIEYVSSNCLQVQEFVVTRAFGIKFSKVRLLLT